MVSRAFSIARSTGGASAQRRSKRFLMISFSRARSLIRSGSVSVRRGKYSSAVRMLCNPGIVIFARPDCGIQFVMIGDVIAVDALRAGLEIRRGVGVADP